MSVETPLRIALIADTFSPLRSSAAIQLRDLSHELVKQGCRVTVIVPTSNIGQKWLFEEVGGIEVLRLKALRTKDVSYVRRTIAEFLMPFAMRRNLRKSPFADVRWAGVIWYAPTIFLAPIVNAVKKFSSCRSYLIIRDIFPEWAVDMRLLNRGIPYWFFKAVERHQYSVADVIGVQTPANLPYFSRIGLRPNQRVEVLQNWLAHAPNAGCSISVSDSVLAGRTIFVYAGNMGVAQGMGIFIDLAEQLHSRHDIGFLFVGRGSDAKALCDDAIRRGLGNVVFRSEIEPEEIPGLYSQCHAGIVALDPRHKTHNVPGKFLTYLQAGLPVLASINPGNDLVHLIETNRIGRVCTEHSVDSLVFMVNQLVDDIKTDMGMSLRCKELSARLFAPEAVVKQIISALAG